MVAQPKNAGHDRLDLRRAAEYAGVNERTRRNYWMCEQSRARLTCPAPMPDLARLHPSPIIKAVGAEHFETSRTRVDAPMINTDEPPGADR